MLFLPQSVYDNRRRLWRDFEAGKTTAEQTFQKMLKQDPDDAMGMMGLGKVRLDEGDLAAAEEYFWRAIQVHPCLSVPYKELAQILNQKPESAALAKALADLAILKTLLAGEAPLENFEVDVEGEELEEFKKLPKAEHARLLDEYIRANRGDEPEEVTERLRPLRLLQQMQEEGDLEPETVDAIVAEGRSIVPLLVGVLRDWAQNMLGDDGDDWVENALALLGETGSPPEILHLLEFVDLDDDNASGAATWALGRIIERHIGEAARFLASIVEGLGPVERLVVAQQIFSHPDLDPDGKLLKSLSENLASWKSAERDSFFHGLLITMAIARGKEGVSLGRATLRQHAGLLSRSARRECEEILSEFPKDVPPLPLGPSPVTVYEICAGDAIWPGDEDEDEDEDQEEEEEFLRVPEQVQRKPTPGRNDPCWCNSGKKYKKCHLDSDEQRDSRPLTKDPAALRGSNEFAGLRKRIGEFLGQVLPEREMRRALIQFLGDQPQHTEGAEVSTIDWILHDWGAPSLGRTVMQEFLARRGAGLTQRERETVEAWTRSFVGLYEVQDLTPGVGLKLKDLIFGGTSFVHDTSMSTELARWDGLFARVVPGERGSELAGIGQTVPRHSIEPLRAWMEEDRAQAGLEWREYLKGNWPRIRSRAFEFADNWMESLRFSNTDGEEFLLSEAVYKMVDETAAIEALRECPEFQEDEPDHFVWLNMKKTVLGNLRIRRNELVLECNSKERLERGKLLLSSAGQSLRHLRDEFTTQKELKSRAAAAPERRSLKEEIPKEVSDEAIANFMEEHYRTWPDIALPALGGKTPRDAVRTAKGRGKVIDILKDIENGEDRKKQAGEPFYDVARLRAELGLD